MKKLLKPLGVILGALVLILVILFAYSKVAKNRSTSSVERFLSVCAPIHPGSGIPALDQVCLFYRDTNYGNQWKTQ